jgi:hypothetical protein
MRRDHGETRELSEVMLCLYLVSAANNAIIDGLMSSKLQTKMIYRRGRGK